MKIYRLLTRLLILLLVIFLVSCAKLPSYISKLVTPPPPPVEEVKAEKPAPPSVKPPEEKAPEVKPAEAKPPEVPLAELQFVPGKLNRNAIGCVLPLSGRYAEIGNKALDAILLSAGIFDSKMKTSWEVVATDSHESAEGVKAAIEHLANQKNVMVIIAITGTAEATDAAREAAKWKVPLILITGKEGVTNESDYVFQHFLTPTQQIQALVKYALDRMNVAIYAVMYPEDDYGEEMVNLFRMETKKIGGKIDRAVPYGKTQTDFTEQISKLTGHKIIRGEKANAGREDTVTPMSVNFEALFIPDSPLRVQMITSQLTFYGVKGIKLLGTSLWNSPDLLKKRPEYLEGAIFVDSFYTNSFYPETNDFIDIYYSAYSREPVNIEALAYDTSEIILSILENSKIQTRQDFIAQLNMVQNYRGVTGNTTFDANRVAQKTAFILKVINGKLHQVR